MTLKPFALWIGFKAMVNWVADEKLKWILCFRRIDGNNTYFLRIMRRLFALCLQYRQSVYVCRMILYFVDSFHLILLTWVPKIEMQSGMTIFIHNSTWLIRSLFQLIPENPKKRLYSSIFSDFQSISINQAQKLPSFKTKHKLLIYTHHRPHRNGYIYVSISNASFFSQKIYIVKNFLFIVEKKSIKIWKESYVFHDIEP